MRMLLVVAVGVCIAGCAPQSGSEDLAELGLPRGLPSVEQSASQPVEPVQEVPMVASEPSVERPAPRMAPTNKVVTPPATPSPSPSFTEHNSGDGNDECFHDCGEPTDYPTPTREQELAALEPYWDSLAAEEIYVLCDSFREEPWAAALTWKAATESRLDPADIAWWFTTQCRETGL